LALGTVRSEEACPRVELVAKAIDNGLIIEVGSYRDAAKVKDITDRFPGISLLIVSVMPLLLLLTLLRTRLGSIGYGPKIIALSLLSAGILTGFIDFDIGLYRLCFDRNYTGLRW
jgi:hypothetical protein